MLSKISFRKDTDPGSVNIARGAPLQQTQLGRTKLVVGQLAQLPWQREEIPYITLPHETERDRNTTRKVRVHNLLEMLQPAGAYSKSEAQEDAAAL